MLKLSCGVRIESTRVRAPAGAKNKEKENISLPYFSSKYKREGGGGSRWSEIKLNESNAKDFNNLGSEIIKIGF